MNKRKAIATFIIIAMVVCFVPVTAVAGVVDYTREVTAEAADIKSEATDVTATTEVAETLSGVVENTLVDMPKEGFWSTTALKAAIDNGLLNGFKEDRGTYIRPDAPLTRAQMAAIVNRAFGVQEEATLLGANDVSADAWYYKDLQKAVKMGTMKLDTKMRPNDSVTRQEAFTILGRALRMKDDTKADLTKFSDVSQIATWATSGMEAMVKAGYIKGDNNRLAPTADMTRAQFAVIMNNLIKQYIKTPGTVTQVASGNVIINTPGITLEEVTITGDLIIGDGVGDGTINLKNVVVKGNLIARGGGIDSIIITGGSVDGKIIISKVDGKIRVFVEGGAEIEIIEICDGKDDVIIEGNLGVIEVTASDTPVIVRNATVKKIDIKTEGAGNIKIADTAKVDRVVVWASSVGTKIDVAGTVIDFETSAQGTKLSGSGTVANAKVNTGANDTTITTSKTIITNDEATGVTGIDGKEVPPNSKVTNEEVVAPPVAFGGGGGGGAVEPPPIEPPPIPAEVLLYTNAASEGAIKILLGATPNALGLLLGDYALLDLAGKWDVAADLFDARASLTTKELIQSALTTAIATAKSESLARAANTATTSAVSAIGDMGSYLLESKEYNIEDNTLLGVWTFSIVPGRLRVGLTGASSYKLTINSMEFLLVENQFQSGQFLVNVPAMFTIEKIKGGKLTAIFN